MNLNYMKDMSVYNFSEKIQYAINMQNQKILGQNEKLNKIAKELTNIQTTLSNKIEEFQKNSNKSPRRLKFSQNDLLDLIKGNKKYSYKLISENFEVPLFKEKSYNLKISLVDKDNNIINNKNRISLTCALFSSEAEPRIIELKENGNLLLCGTKEIDLANGLAMFRKMKISEVTSKFPNGNIILVVFPKSSSFHYDCRDRNYINIENIEPFVINKLVVKAKKINHKY